MHPYTMSFPERRVARSEVRQEIPGGKRKLALSTRGREMAPQTTTALIAG